MDAGRLNILLGLGHYDRPVYRPKWFLYLAGAAMWLLTIALVWALMS